MKALFITGTDTGVGKTVLTGLLLSHLRRQGRPAFALKPFCSGGREDAECLHALQKDELALDDVNPFHFREPLAPLVAARNEGRSVTLNQVLGHILRVAEKVSRSDAVMLIEGAGGLLSPLGEGVNALDLIERLPAGGRSHPGPRMRLEVVVVARNALGTVNHTLLTLAALQAYFGSGGKKRMPVPRCQVVLMKQAPGDGSSRTNASLLRELAPGIPILECPNLPGGDWKRYRPSVARMLELILDCKSKG